MCILYVAHLMSFNYVIFTIDSELSFEKEKSRSELGRAKEDVLTLELEVKYLETKKEGRTTSLTKSQ